MAPPFRAIATRGRAYSFSDVKSWGVFNAPLFCSNLPLTPTLSHKGRGSQTAVSHDLIVEVVLAD